MDFLFGPLPLSSNFQMTDEQLALWQRNAISACECDNFVNGRIEAVRHRRYLRPSTVSSVERSAIDAAVQRHGLRPRDDASAAHLPLRRVHPRENDTTAVYAPLVRRLRLVSANAERENDNFLDNFYQEVYAATILERGLGLQHP